MAAIEQPDDDTAHGHALRYAGAGLRVLPIKPGFKRPPMASWQHAATHEPAKISAWYTGLYRDAGVGIALGPQPDGRYLFAVDIDLHDPDANGFDTLHDLEHEHGELPETWTAITGSDGGHRIFAAPPGVIVRNQQAAGQRLGPGIDVRGDGGQIVVAPTLHPDTGRAYAWEHGYAPWERPVATAPAWLVALVREPTPAPAPPASSGNYDGPSVADQLRATWDWHHELTVRGWTLDRSTSSGDSYWVRPGKDPRQGHSAVLHPGGPFVVFTTAMPEAWRQVGHRTHDGSGYSLSPFDFMAANDHNGSRSDAARALGGVPEPPLTEAEQLAVSDDPDEQLIGMLIDWPDFWANGHGEPEWLAEPVIPAHRSVALFAPGGTGKSLLSLWLSVHLATGTDPFSGNRIEPINVLYLDYEMTADDLCERLEQMGFDESADLSHLSYAQLPSLPGLDEPEGGKAVVRLAALVDADLVVIDTFSRAVHGDENDADTVRRWYRYTGLHLKHDGRAFLRVDHAGKDIAKGQRGTSAKNDDVDIVWQMTAKESGAFTLRAKKRRMGWVPETVEIELSEDDVLKFGLLGGESWPTGTKEAAQRLDELGVELELGWKKAGAVLREAGHRVSNEVLRAAVKYRKSRSTTFFFVGDQPGQMAPQGGPDNARPPLLHDGAAPPAAQPPADTAKDLLEGGPDQIRPPAAPPPALVRPTGPNVVRPRGRSEQYVDNYTADDLFGPSPEGTS
jgi:hypothetical protein